MSKKKVISKKKVLLALTGAVITASAIIMHMIKKTEKVTYEATMINPVKNRKKGFYEKYIKRILDVICAFSAIVVFSPIYLVVAVLVKIKLGSPVLFTQERPGLVDENGKETIFKMYKFRTMTDERDENGELLPDDIRLTKFGKWLRSTSLDELPEAFNILNGTMSVVGPRPQLVRDMVFMTDKQRMRHTAKPGLSGLAQVNGRNAITWEDKLNWDLKYIERISFIGDIKIIIDTVKKAFIKQEGISQEDMATAEDFGDYLLRDGKINGDEYKRKQEMAKTILNNCNETDEQVCVDDEIFDNLADEEMERYSVLMSLYIKEKPEYLDLAIRSIIDQTLKADEIVIVKDGEISTELQDVLNHYSEMYPDLFNIVGYKENRGLGLALNYGLEHCRNELVARMDTDDIAKPERCMKQVKAFMNHPEYAIIGSAVDEFYGTPENITGRRVVPTKYNEIYEFAKRRSAFNHPSVMYRKSKVLEFGGYSDLRRNQDVDLFGRMIFGGCKVANFQESLLWFRSDENLAKRRKSWENTWSYIDTIRRFHKMGYSALSDVFVVAGAQTVMYLMPVKVQNWLYKTFLRK